MNDNKCPKCGNNLRTKRITVNYWVRGGMSCENCGTKQEDVTYCPKCDEVPHDLIRYRSRYDDLF